MLKKLFCQVVIALARTSPAFTPPPNPVFLRTKSGQLAAALARTTPAFVPSSHIVAAPADLSTSRSARSSGTVHPGKTSIITWQTQPRHTSGRGVSRTLKAALAATVAVATTGGAAVLVASLLEPAAQHSAGGAPPTVGAGASPSVGAGESPNTAQQQASAVNSLLTMGAGSSQIVSSAINDTMSCGDPATDAGKILQVLRLREGQLQQAEDLTLTALPNGQEMRTNLIQALSASVYADNDYLTWVQQQAVQCVPHSSPPQTAVAASTQAAHLRGQVHQCVESGSPGVRLPVSRSGQPLITAAADGKLREAKAGKSLSNYSLTGPKVVVNAAHGLGSVARSAEAERARELRSADRGRPQAPEQAFARSASV